MKRILNLTIALLLFVAATSNTLAGRGGSRSSGSSYKSSFGKSSSSYKSWSKPSSTFKSYNTYKKPTYNIGGTKYIMGETYKTTGYPKVERSSSAKREFLKSRGYERTPSGFDIDHIIPLSKGGVDKPYNMQLLPKEVHKQKTANERKRK